MKIRVKVSRADLGKNRNEELNRQLRMHKHQIVEDKKKKAAKYAARGRVERPFFNFPLILWSGMQNISHTLVTGTESLKSEEEGRLLRTAG